MFDFLKIPFRVFAVVCLCAVAFSQTSQGPTMIPQTNRDFFVGQVNGFYPTIQSAVTATCAISSGPGSLGSRVIVSAGSPADGTSGYTISAVTGCAKVPIIDQRAQPATTCSWGGSAYSCSSGSGSASIAHTSNVVKGDGVGNGLAATPGVDYVVPSGNISGTAAGLSGTPALPNGTTAPTQTVGDNTTKVATTAFVLANGGGGSGVVQSAPQFRLFIQPNTGTAAIAGPASTSQNAVTPILQGSANSDIFQTGGGNNGIANAQTAGLTDIVVPAGSTSTEDPFAAVTVNGTHLQSRGPASVLDYYFNPLPGNQFPTAESVNCDQSMQPATGVEIQSRCHQLTAIWSDAGEDVTGTPTVHIADQVIATAYGQGIHQARDTMFFCYTDDDCGLDYGYLTARAAALAGASEGGVLNSRQGLEGYAGVVSEIVSSGSGGTVVTLSSPGQTNSANIIDLDSNIDSGVITGTTAGPGSGSLVPSSFTTSTTHALSTGFGFLTAFCGENEIRNDPKPATCTFTTGTVSGVTGFGSFNTTTKVAVGDSVNYECAQVTAVSGGNITLNLAYFHPANTPIYQGVGSCAILIEGKGNSPVYGSATGTFPNFPVMGARSTTAWDTMYVMKNSQNGIVQIPLPSAQSATITSASQTGTTVTLTLSTVGGFFNHYSPLAGQSICVSGVSNSAFNICGITGAVVTNGGLTLTYTVGASATITGTGGLINVGTTGAPTVNGFANYAIKCGALVTHVNGVTFDHQSGDGSVQVAYNDCPWTPGHSVQEPNNIAQTFLGSRVSWQGDTDPTQFGGNVLNQWSLFHNSWSAGTFLELNGEDSDPIGSFINYGGTFKSHTGIIDNDPGMGLFIQMATAPISTGGTSAAGGTFAHIGLFPAGGFQTNYDLFDLDAISGKGILNWNVTNNTLTLQGQGAVPTFMVNGALAGSFLSIPANPNIFGSKPFNATGLAGYMSFSSSANGLSDALVEAGGYFANTVYAGSQNYFSFELFPTFTPATTTYCYVMTSTTAFATGGTGETLPAPPVCLSNGPASLTGGANIIVEGVEQGGTNGARVYRTSGPGGAGFICSFVAPGNNCADTGQTAGAAPPTVDTSGQFWLSGHQFAGTVGTGLQIPAATGTFVSGHCRGTDANLNEVDVTCGGGGSLPTTPSVLKGNNAGGASPATTNDINALSVTRFWSATLLEALHNSTNQVVNIFVYGDSFSICWITQCGVGPASKSDLWPYLLTTQLQQQYGSHGTGMVPVLANGASTLNTQWSISGTFSFDNTMGPSELVGEGAAGSSLIHLANGATATFTSAVPYDTLQLYYGTTSSTGDILVSIDGTGVGTANVGSATNSGITVGSMTAREFTTTAAALGTHVATVNCSGAGGCNFYALNGTAGTTGVSVHNVAVGGMNSNFYDSAAKMAFSDLVPGGHQGAISFIEINDANAATAPSLYQTNLTFLVSHEQGLSASQSASFLMALPGQPVAPVQSAMLPLTAAAQTLSQTLNVGFIDSKVRWTNVFSSGSGLWDATGTPFPSGFQYTHPSTMGDRDIYSQIYATLIDPVPFGTTSGGGCTNNCTLTGVTHVSGSGDTPLAVSSSSPNETGFSLANSTTTKVYTDFLTGSTFNSLGTAGYHCWSELTSAVDLLCASDTQFILNASFVNGFASGDPILTPMDTGLSRLGPASEALGNGTAGDKSGTLSLKQIILDAATDGLTLGSGAGTGDVRVNDTVGVQAAAFGYANSGVGVLSGTAFMYAEHPLCFLPAIALGQCAVKIATTGFTTFNYSISAPSVQTATFTVSALPSASAFPAGTWVTVTDASTFTPGTCTGGGSDYMMAVTNGTTWSCH